MTLPWKRPNSTVSPRLHRFDSPIQQIFEEFWNEFPTWTEGTTTSFVPKVNVLETSNGYRISAELPGVDEKDIEVTLEDNVLRIRGEKKFEQEEKDTKYTRYETHYGTFERYFHVPQEVDAENIQATFKNGILNVTLTRTQNPQRSRKIEIKSTH